MLPVTSSTYITLAKDIKRKERELARLHQISKREAKFLSVVRHQLRTPLTVIIWIIGDLRDDPICNQSQKTKEMLNDAYKAAQNMIEIIDDFLGVLKINPRAIQLKKQQLSLHRIIEKILKHYKTRIKEKGLQIFYRGTNNFPRVVGDKQMLADAIRHIISNALAYTPENGSIKITLTDEVGTALIAITDTGIGIKKIDAEKIYLQYYRGKNAVKMQPASSGLGLYVARPIIRAHKGELWFKSELGKGTTFFVRLPKSSKSNVSTSAASVM